MFDAHNNHSKPDSLSKPEKKPEFLESPKAPGREFSLDELGLEWRSLRRVPLPVQEPSLVEKKVFDSETNQESAVFVDRRPEILDAMVDRGLRSLKSANLAGQIRQIGELPGPELNASFKELIGKTVKAENGQDIYLNANLFNSYLETRGLAKIFTDLQIGDKVVTFLSSSDKEVSIKKLNQALGPNLTDVFITARKDLLRKHFGAYLEELDQDYKQGIFKIKSEIDVENFRNNVLQKGLDEINQALTVWLGEHEVKYDYKMTSGINENKIMDSSLGQVANNFLTVQNAIQGAHLNRSKGKNEAIYEEADFNNQLMQIAEKKKYLQAKGSLTDHTGQIYNIFVDGLINRDLLRKIRQDKLFVDSQNADQIDRKAKLEDYLKAVNFIDFFRPYTTPELADNSSKVEQVQKRHSLAEKIKKANAGVAVDFDKNDVKLLQTAIEVENKDENFDSDTVFQEKATNMEVCTYLSFDVLDVGINQLHDYEKKINAWNSGEPDARQHYLKDILDAGDGVTESLRAFRKEVKAILDKAGLAKDAAYLVGGDEFTIALPTKNLAPAVLFEIKKACEKYNGVRMVKSLRQSVPEQPLAERHREHQESLLQAENGIASAKFMEKEIQGFRQNYLNQLKSRFSLGESEIIKQLDRLFSESGVNNYIVEQLPGRTFDVAIWETLPFDLEQENYQSVLSAWQQYLDKEVQKLTF